MDTKVDLANGYALLIGVESYRAYDSTGQHDLPAGWNDVLAFWVLCRRLGFPPQNIHVLASEERVSTLPVLSKDARQAFEDAFHDAVERLDKGLEARSITKADATSKTKKILAGKHYLTEKLSYREEQVRSAELAYFTKLKKHKLDPGEAYSSFVAWFADSGIKKAAQGDRAAAPTYDNILAEVRQMAAHGESFPKAPLLLAYSGHGARLSDGGDLALCPEDVGPGLERAIPFATLSEHLGRLENLTVVLDCCDAASSGEHGARGELHSTSLAPSAAEASNASFEGFAGRVLCASGRDQHAYQAVFGDRWHGAFTWAVTTTLWQWRMKEHGDLALDTVTYGHVLEQATGLLKQLDYAQDPHLLSKHEHVGALRVFQAGSEVREGGEGHTRKLRRGQIDPSGDKVFTVHKLYELTKDTGTNRELTTLLATIVVVNKSKLDAAREKNSTKLLGWDFQKEYWRINRLFSTSDLKLMKLERSGTDEEPWPVTNATFSVAQLGYWRYNPSGTPHMITADGNLGLTASVSLTITPVGNGVATETWKYSISWFNSTNANLFGTDYIGNKIDTYNLTRQAPTDSKTVAYTALNTSG